MGAGIVAGAIHHGDRSTGHRIAGVVACHSLAYDGRTLICSTKEGTCISLDGE
jgi:hypothetical protein